MRRTILIILLMVLCVSGGWRQGNPYYIGQVATRTWVAQQLDTTKNQFNSRSFHFARDNLSLFQIVFWNGYAVGGNINPNGTERGVGSAATLFAAIEYPASTFTRITWNSGATSISIADNAIATSDSISVSIPNGATFYVRMFYTNTTGIPNDSGQNGNYSNGDAFNVGVSGLSDLTLGGTITNNHSSYLAVPVAIIAQTTVPSVVVVGDSIGFGSADTNDAAGDRGFITRAVCPTYACMSIASGADAAYLFLGSNAKRLAIAAYATTAILQYGVNDFTNGRTATQLLADRAAIAALLSKRAVIETTVTPRSVDPTDNCATTTNQTVATWDAQRVTANTTIRAGGRSGIAHEADATSYIETSLNSGIIQAPPGFAAPISPDCVHYYKAGYLQASPSIDLSWIK